MREKIHEMENVLEDGKLHYMYDSAYGDIKFGTIHGLTPFYNLLNQLFHYTLCPKGSDSDTISNMSKNLIARMALGKLEFSVLTSFGRRLSFVLCHPRRAVTMHLTYLL
jgi:hypothetical protein